MEVIINGNVVEYESDFDCAHEDQNVKRNWMVSKGDFFKYPVKIDGVDFVEFFIKRFNGESSLISGYEFLLKIKGKKFDGLPVVFDLVKTQECGNTVFYLFMEYIPGKTLDVLQREGFTFKPSKLGKDLFNAIKSIHDKGFWFPDFDPKNFYRSDKGDFYIIDLDSTYPLATIPVPKIYGSKDFWVPVYDFYVENGEFTREEVKKMKGDLLNILSLIYLVGLYSFYLDEQGEDLTGRSIGRLNKYLRNKHKYFFAMMVYCFNKNNNLSEFNQTVPTYEVFNNFMETVLFGEDFERTISDAPKIPEILFFTANGKATRDLEIKAGNKIVLEWETKDTTSNRLLPGNRLLNSKGALAISPFEDTTYSLQAIHKYKSKAQEQKRSIDVNIYDPDLKKPTIKFNIVGYKQKALLLEDSPYSVKWKVSDAEEVCLDEVEVPHSDTRMFTATSACTHTLQATNIMHDRKKRSTVTIAIETEKRPEIQLTVSPLEIKSGQSITLTWKSPYGKNISIIRDGITIAFDQPNDGYMNLSLKVDKGRPSPNAVHFTASAFSMSGQWTLDTEDEQIVTIQSRISPIIWIILVVLFAIAVLLIAFNMNQ